MNLLYIFHFFSKYHNFYTYCAFKGICGPPMFWFLCQFYKSNFSFGNPTCCYYYYRKKYFHSHFQKVQIYEHFYSTNLVIENLENYFMIDYRCKIHSFLEHCFYKVENLYKFQYLHSCRCCQRLHRLNMSRYCRKLYYICFFNIFLDEAYLLYNI